MAVDQNINELLMLYCKPSTSIQLSIAIAHHIHTVHQFNTDEVYTAIMNNI